MCQVRSRRSSAPFDALHLTPCSGLPCSGLPCSELPCSALALHLHFTCSTSTTCQLLRGRRGTARDLLSHFPARKSLISEDACDTEDVMVVQRRSAKGDEAAAAETRGGSTEWKVVVAPPHFVPTGTHSCSGHGIAQTVQLFRMFESRRGLKDRGLGSQGVPTRTRRHRGCSREVHHHGEERWRWRWNGRRSVAGRVGSAVFSCVIVLREGEGSHLTRDKSSVYGLPLWAHRNVPSSVVRVASTFDSASQRQDRSSVQPAARKD